MRGGKRLWRNRETAGAQICDRRGERDAHPLVQIAKGKGGLLGASGECPARFEAVRKPDHLVERTHDRVGDRVFANRREHAIVPHAETLARELGAQTRMQHDRMCGLKNVDRHPALGAFAQKPLDRVQPREIVQQSRETCAISVEPVDRGESSRHPRDAQHVREAVALRERVTHGARGADELDAAQWRTSR